MTINIRRRGALGVIAGSVLSACTGLNKGVNQAQQTSSNRGLFQHGVASGDPDSSSMVLWTRVTTEPSSVSVKWQLAQDKTFSHLVKSGALVTDPASDYTVKVIVEGLNAGTTYYYRFMVGATVSAIGRTKTLPLGDTEQYGIALASCSNFPFGYFNSYQAIADDPEIDLVLHTGDYIYEYGADEWGAETGKALGRVHQPAHEIVSLADYRQRHAQYKRDAGSQAMHRKHPMVCCWDDHESTNNPWQNGAQNHQEGTEGSWLERRAASVQAYYEWMPIRDPGTNDARLKFTREYKIGALANLVTLESRHTARAEQINYKKFAADITSMKTAEQFKRDVIGASGREMISVESEDVLLKSFSATNTPWRLLGNASPIARMQVPDVAALGTLQGERPEQLETHAAKQLLWKGKYQLPFYTDTWDGYPWARERLYQRCANAGINDMIFLTGDSHSFWFNNLADEQGQAMGLELGTAGISSPGDFVESGWSLPVAEKLDRAFETQLDEVVWTDNFHQGFVKLVLTPSVALASYVAVSTVLEPSFTTKVIKQVKIANKDHHLTYST